MTPFRSFRAYEVHPALGLTALIVASWLGTGCERGADHARSESGDTPDSASAFSAGASRTTSPQQAGRSLSPPTEQPATHLYVWAGDTDRKEPDFLAVLDVRPGSPRYGRLVTTLPVGARGSMPHHTEHELPPSARLFANGFMAGLTFRFHLGNPEAPRLTGSFGPAGDYTYPHSYVRLPNGHVLATFQGRGERNLDPGGLVELDGEGRVVRSASAADPRAPRELLRPYSLAVVPELDRVVTTSYDMGEDMGLRGGRRGRTRVIQVWRLSDLSILETIVLPPGPRGYEGEQPGEPRVLADGRTVLVSTFACGLYRVTGLEGADPDAQFVFGWDGSGCAVPVIVGKFWIEPVPSASALVALDVSDTARPREVSRLTLEARHHPHWLALDPASGRIVVTDRGDGERRVLIVRVSAETGELALDESFREEGAERSGFSFDRASWPHGASGSATPHGAVFGP